MSLKNKVVLITGAAKRLGRAMALHFAKKGARVAAHYHTSTKEAKTLTHQRIQCFQADLSDMTELERLAQEVLAKFSKVDILIHNAAVFYPTPFGKITADDWQAFINTNLRAPVFLTQALWSHQPKRPLKIIHIADSGSPRTRSTYLPYWLSKSGLMQCTETLAKILRPYGQINTVAPGPIGFPEDRKKFQKEFITPPKDIVEAVDFFATCSTAITGNILYVDSGRRYL